MKSTQTLFKNCLQTFQQKNQLPKILIKNKLQSKSYQKLSKNNNKQNLIISNQNRVKFQFSSEKSSAEQQFKTETYINIGGQKEKQGVLTIVPTPIGNLKDLSIRQYEILLKADVIACEDTRVTGNMLNLIKQKRISESFKNTFNVDFDQYEENQQAENGENFQGKEEENDENSLALIEEFEKKELDLANNVDYGQLQNWPTREERIMSKIIELRQKARKILAEEESLNIYQSREEDEFYDTSFYGLEDEFIKYLKAKIAQSKKNKGRGILVSYHKYNENLRLERLVKMLNYGLNIALVSDAGTPCISDPGYLLIDKCIKENIPIENLPGSSAVLVALSASGFPSDRFIFEGFLSKTQIEKEQKLERIKNLQITSVVFENHNRLAKTLLSIEKYFGEKQQIFIGFEFTKMFEKKYRGQVRELYEILTDPDLTKQSFLKGEITIVIPPHTPEYNVDLFQVKEENVKSRQNLYKEWEKPANLSSKQFEELKGAMSYNKDFDMREYLRHHIPEMQNQYKEFEDMVEMMKNQMPNEKKINEQNNQEQLNFEKNENTIFQIDARVLGNYLNDNLDVTNKELAQVLSDILKISKTRSYNLVKSLRKQNDASKIWNDLLKNPKKK